MLDYEQRKVLRFLNEMRASRQPFSDTDLRNRTKIYDRDTLVKLCKELEREGYFEDLSLTLIMDIVNIELSYKGISYLKVQRKEFCIAVGRWFSENLVGLAALIVSIVALIRTTPLQG